MMEPKGKQRVLTGGMILVTLGILIILHNATGYGLGKSWPILLLVIAMGTLIQKIADVGGWIIGAAGLIFLMKVSFGFDISNFATYLLPLLLILVGLNILIKHFQKNGERPE